jgi:hypothetical protein
MKVISMATIVRVLSVVDGTTTAIVDSRRFGECEATAVHGTYEVGERVEFFHHDKYNRNKFRKLGAKKSIDIAIKS